MVLSPSGFLSVFWALPASEISWRKKRVDFCGAWKSWLTNKRLELRGGTNARTSCWTSIAYCLNFHLPCDASWIDACSIDFEPCSCLRWEEAFHVLEKRTAVPSGQLLSSDSKTLRYALQHLTKGFSWLHVHFCDGSILLREMVESILFAFE